MANLNNIYANAAYVGCFAGFFAGRSPSNAVATSYLDQKTAAGKIATAIDALIPFDALVTTGASNTQLAQTTNTITANEQFRANLLQQLCFAAMEGRSPLAAQAASATLAAAIVAAWTEGLLGLTTP